MDANFEKVYWKTWGPKFDIRFNMRVLKLHPKYSRQWYKTRPECQDILKIETLHEHKANEIFTKISYCQGYESKAQNLTFKQMTQDGLKTVTINLEKIDEKPQTMVAFPNLAGSLGMGKPRECYDGYGCHLDNNAVSKKSKFSVYSNKYGEYVEISNLKILP